MNVRAGVCVEFRSKGSPARGVRASATAGDPSRHRPTIDFLTPGEIAFSTAAADAVFSFPLVFGALLRTERDFQRLHNAIAHITASFIHTLMHPHSYDMKYKYIYFFLSYGYGMHS
jgi:hypothetical protein